MRINDDFIRDNVEGQCVLISVGGSGDYANGIFTLNEIGERIVDLLEEGRETEKIVDVLLDEYEAERPILHKYVDDFIKELRGYGIVVDD